MGTIAERLEELGYPLPPSPKPQGSYVPAVRTGNLVYIAGQLPMRDGQVAYRGKVGKDLGIDEGREAARLCFLNALAALGSLGLTPEQVTRVVRLGGFVQCVEGFGEQAKVMNGASDLCQAVFGDRGPHARASVGVHALPLNAAVEVEALFEMEPVG